MLVGEPSKRATLEEVMQHVWMQMGQPALIGDMKLPFSFSAPSEIAPDIIEQMESLGFPREQAMDSIVNNRYDVAASTYYLLLSRKFKARPSLPLPSDTRAEPPSEVQPTAQRVSRGTRGHKRHHTVDVPMVEMEAAPASHADPLRDTPRCGNNKPTQPVIPGPAQNHYVPQQPVPTPMITFTPTLHGNERPEGPSAAASGRMPDPVSNGNPGLLPFWRQRGHNRSRSVDVTSSGGQGPPLHDYTSHIIKEATILNSSPNGSRLSRRSPKSVIPSGHPPPSHLSPNAPSHHLPPDIERVKAAARRKSMRPKSVGPWNPAEEDEAPQTPNSPELREDGEAEVQIRPVAEPIHEALAKEEIHRPGHRRAQSYDIRALKPKVPSKSPPSDEHEDEDPLIEDGDARRAEQGKSNGALNSLVNSLKSGLGLLRGRNEKEKEPRSIRFALNVSTTSAKSADEIMQEVSRVLAHNNLSFTTSAYCAHCSCDDVHFEVEVCKLPMLSMNGIRFNRISGDAWAYKRIAARLIEQMEL